MTLESGMKQLYVDGGVVVNYPLHVFDGMYNKQILHVYLGRHLLAQYVRTAGMEGNALVTIQLTAVNCTIFPPKVRADNCT